MDKSASHYRGGLVWTLITPASHSVPQRPTMSTSVIDQLQGQVTGARGHVVRGGRGSRRARRRPSGADGRVTAKLAAKLSNLLRTAPVRDEAPARVDQDGAACSAAEAVLSFLSKNF